MMDLREYWTLQWTSGGAVMEQTPVISNFTEPLLADKSETEPWWKTKYSPENFVAFSPISTSTHLTVQKSDRIIFENCYWSILRKVARWLMQSDVWNWNVSSRSEGSSCNHFFIRGSQSLAPNPAAMNPRYAFHASNNNVEYEKKILNLKFMAMKYSFDCQETADISICKV